MDYSAALQAGSPLLLGLSRDLLSGQRGGVGASMQGLGIMLAQQAEAKKKMQALRGLQALGINVQGAQGGLGQAPQAGAMPQASMSGAQPQSGLEAATGGAMQLPPQLQRTIQALAMSGDTQGAYKLASDYALQSAAPKEYEWDRITAGMSPEDRARAARIRAGLDPDADTALRVGAQNAPRPATFRPTTPEEAQVYGGPGQIDTATGRFYPLKEGTGMTVYGPDGQPIMTTGDPGKVKPFTEGQSKDVVYATRARGALEAFEPYASALTSFGENMAEYDPTGVVRGRVQSDEFQLAKNAGEEFLQAILRKDTGAAITSQEQDLYGKTYLPQPGDNALVLEQKARARQRAVAAIEAGMSPAQMIAQERGLRGASPEAAPRPYKDMSDDELKRALGLQ